MPGRQVEVLEEDGRLVARVLVQADLADPQHAGPVEELGDHRDHLARQRDVLGLLGVDAEPAVVLDAVERGPLRLVLGQLAEVVAEALRRPTDRSPPRTPARSPARSRPGPSACSRRSCARPCGCADRCIASQCP